MKLCTVAKCNRPNWGRGFCNLHYQRWYKYGDPNVRKNRAWEGSCTVCGRKRVSPVSRLCREHMREKSQAYRKKNPNEVRASNRESAIASHRRRRELVIRTYGGACVCCGESRLVFLCMDHIDGGGNAHRRSLSTRQKEVGGGTVYAWLVRNSFPPGFRVLCHNCNFAEAHGGCPHKHTSKVGKRLCTRNGRP